VVVAGQIVQRRPILPPQPQKVFEALGRHERDAGSAALEQGVGGNRGTVNQQLDCVRRLERVQRVKQADGGILRRRHHLADFDRPIIGEGDEIGEGSADIDAYPHTPPTLRLDLQASAASTPASPSVPNTHSNPTQSPSRTYSGITSLVRTWPDTTASCSKPVSA